MPSSIWLIKINSLHSCQKRQSISIYLTISIVCASIWNFTYVSQLKCEIKPVLIIWAHDKFSAAYITTSTIWSCLSLVVYCTLVWWKVGPSLKRSNITFKKVSWWKRIASNDDFKWRIGITRNTRGWVLLVWCRWSIVINISVDSIRYHRSFYSNWQQLPFIKDDSFTCVCKSPLSEIDSIFVY